MKKTDIEENVAYTIHQTDKYWVLHGGLFFIIYLFIYLLFLLLWYVIVSLYLMFFISNKQICHGNDNGDYIIIMTNISTDLRSLIFL